MLGLWPRAIDCTGYISNCSVEARVEFSTTDQSADCSRLMRPSQSSALRDTVILWQVSTSVGSVFRALIEKRGTRLQGSVFKSIICSPNPTGSSATPSWIISPFVNELPSSAVTSWEQHTQLIISALVFCIFSLGAFVPLHFPFFHFVSVPVGSDQTLTLGVFAHTAAFVLFWKFCVDS